MCAFVDKHERGSHSRQELRKEGPNWRGLPGQLSLTFANTSHYNYLLKHKGIRGDALEAKSFKAQEPIKPCKPRAARDQRLGEQTLQTKSLKREASGVKLVDLNFIMVDPIEAYRTSSSQAHGDPEDTPSEPGASKCEGFGD